MATLFFSIDQVSSEYPKNTLIISRVFSVQTPSFLVFCPDIYAFLKKIYNHSFYTHIGNIYGLILVFSNMYVSLGFLQ